MKKPEENLLYWELLDNLSPFKNKLFYPIACLIFILIVITFPPANYYGLTSVSSSSQVQNSHRVLFDATFICSIITLISLSIKYAFIGFNREFQERLEAYSLDIYQYKKSQKTNYSPKKTFIATCLIFGTLLLIFFMTPPMLDANIKYDWMYRGNVYISFIGMYFLFLGAFSGTLMSILSTEVYRNVRRK